ncbi:GNAT family N-acetyltransferase [Amycolatopsis magusensis]|uniref:GNAT family N-acetyltransferase n=1 Tax=Amycolatopsis magusensis TaxID=882444 RepID=UPI0037A7CCD3
MSKTGFRTPSAVSIGGTTTIRRLESIDEYRQCEKLQEQIWGPADIGGNRVVAMLTAQENGGHVFGAFAESGELAGFAYSFAGYGPDRRPRLCSIMIAVDERFRGQGIGYRLKQAQRHDSLAKGIEVIMWTFDPLQRVNAALNIRRLGAIARTYRANLYGNFTGLNSGLDTDRLVVEWWLRRHPRPSRWHAPSLATPICQVIADPRSGLPRIASADHDVDSDTLFLPIPPSLAELKRVDLALAQDWRTRTRELFLDYLGRGYVVVDFLTAGSWPGYVLRRPPC